MKHLIAFIIVLFGSQDCLHAYPVPPRPLRLLVKESQHIIIGYVSSVRDSFIRSEKIENGKLTSSIRSGPETATIKVIESLQGSVNADSIHIESYINAICPEPARYQKQTLVIAFLDKDDKGHYTTHALSYGVKKLRREEIEIYKKRILEIQQILKINDQEQQFTETIEWLIKCAEIDATQWEGLTELNPRWGYISSQGAGKQRNLNTLLTPGQIARLKPVLFNAARVEIDLGLADLLYHIYPQEIEERLIKMLKSIEPTNFLMAAEYISRLKSTHHLPEVKELIYNHNTLSFEEKKKNTGELISQFIKIYTKHQKQNRL